MATPRSFNTEIGLPLTVLTADQSTRYLVLEMGARHKGDIAYLASLTPPRIGLVLNVGSAHIGEFGSKAAIAAAKGELVEALPDAGHGGVAVLNADDELVAAMATRTAAGVLRYGQAPDAAVRASDVGFDDQGRASFTLITPAGTAPVRLQMPGEHQVSNALATAAVAHALGLETAAAAGALSAARSLVPGPHAGHRAGRRSHDHQRRLQRQPRIHARRDCAPWPRWALAAGPSPCSGRCASSARTPRPGTRRPVSWSASSGSTCSSRSAPRTPRPWPGRPGG